MLDEVKQKIKITSNAIFREVNNFGFLTSFLILVLANIIIAAIQILRVIRIEDIRSIPVKDEIDKNLCEFKVIIIEIGVSNIRDEVTSHQYFLDTAGKINREIEIKYSFNIYL
jgi:hypothetical protein